ncbi:MAG: hypothetical protein QNJ46_27850 [Leptolyngbyaceae cyanobacterium MO_188.B28]|nr:hypothetical protein [Leptolyngbyaceae cyanobacterium MO_188.B28]
MSEQNFYDEISLAEVAETMGKKAVKLGLIRSLTVRIFSDSWQFYLPNHADMEPLTPEEAYLQLKALVEHA